MQYRRARTKGGTYFFTVVTYNRMKILCQSNNVSLLRQAFRHVMEKHPYTIDAFVLLPDHLHCLWTLSDGDRDYSKRWRLIKSYFTRKCHNKHKHIPSASRKKKKEQALWQHRFWEHLIRNEHDFVRHVEYIHYNPVKHGLVNAPKDWEYSSYKIASRFYITRLRRLKKGIPIVSSCDHYVRDGMYDLEWGAGRDITFDAAVGNE